MHGKSARSTARIAAAASSTELVASWKRTIPAPIPWMSLARDCPEGFIQQACHRAGRTSKSPSRFAARSSKIQQNTARPGKTGRAYARHPGSMKSKEQTGNRGLGNRVRRRRSGGRDGIAARRNRGLIYEAYEPSAELAGSFLNMASNGLDTLRAIDAHTPVLTQGFPPPHMVMWSGTGKRLGEVAKGLALADGTTSIAIRRAALHGALGDEVIRRGIRIEYGKGLADATAGRDRTIHGRHRGQRQDAYRRRWHPFPRSRDSRFSGATAPLHRPAQPWRLRSGCDPRTERLTRVNSTARASW